MRVGGLDVLGIGADIADVGEGEGNHLAGVAGVGHHLLIAGHGGVEAQLADRLALRPEPLPPGDPAVGEYQDARRPIGGWRGRGGRIGQDGSLSAGFNDVAKPQPLGLKRGPVNAVKSRNPRYIWSFPASGD